MRVVRSDEHQRSLLDDLVLTVDIMYRAPPEYKEQLVEFVAMNRVRVVYIVLLTTLMPVTLASFGRESLGIAMQSHPLI